MSSAATLAAVDLGASSGRVIAARLEDGAFSLTETARFPNGPVPVPVVPPGGGRVGGDRAAQQPGSSQPAESRLHWDLLALWRGLREGLHEGARRFGAIEAIGIDSWAVDYGLLGSDGCLLSNPVSYRDGRTAGVPMRVFDRVDPAAMYGINGLQVQDFNTVFQLVAETPDLLRRAGTLLLIPDLLAAWLTGEPRAEVTNASTTGLVDATTRIWSEPLIGQVETAFDTRIARLLPDLVEPGTRVGRVRPEVLDLSASDGDRTPVYAVGSHDTASAVVAVPAEREDFAYISSGTWSLVGLELPAPVLTHAARRANFTNELGVDGTVRFLRNVAGLWVLNETRRTWAEAGAELPIAEITRLAAEAEPLRTVVDLDAPAFFPPGDMPARLADAARAAGQRVPETPGQIARAILDSLALAYRRAVREAAAIAGRDVSVVHMVGGGTANELLSQLAADAIGLPVVCGPAEGTALGNLAVAARGAGYLHGDLGDLRRVIRASTPLRTHDPRAETARAWAAAEARLR